MIIETSSPSLATKCAHTTHAAWGVVAKLPGLRRDLWLLGASGILGQLQQYGHCVCLVNMMAVVEISRHATVCIFLDF